jgi:hypothetical protein
MPKAQAAPSPLEEFPTRREASGAADWTNDMVFLAELSDMLDVSRSQLVRPVYADAALRAGILTMVLAAWRI